MNIRTIATLAFAILLGLVAVLLVRNYVGSSSKGPVGAAMVGTVPVVVASQQIARGAVLQPGNLKVTQIPVDAAPVGAFSTVAQLTGAAGAQRVALRSIPVNEAILPTKVSGPGGRATLSAVVVDGMRAVSLKSNDVAGVAGFVLPGDRVDVLLTRTLTNGDTVTQVIADNVIVLGVDQSDNDEADKPMVAKAVTVQVTPDQAQTIALGQSVGTVALALRSVSDGGLPMRRATTVAQLGFYRPPAAPTGSAAAVNVRVPPPPPPPPPPNVHVTRGLDITGYRVGMR